MLLSDLKELLGMSPEPSQKDKLLQKHLDAAISLVIEKCGEERFLDEKTGEYKFPAAVEMAIKTLVEGMSTNEAIQSDSVSGGMSKTYRNGGYHAAAMAYLKPFIRVRVIPWG